MKHVAAYLLAQLGGNASPSAEDLTAIMASVGAEADADKVADLIGKTSGKDLVELLAAGRAKMAVLGGGGGGGGGGGAPAAAAKEPEPEPEEEEEDMGFDLFD